MFVIGGLWVPWARLDSIEQKKYNSYEYSETGYRLSIFARLCRILRRPAKLIIFRFRKNTFFSKIFFWLDQRASGVTVGGFKKKYEKKFLLSNTNK